MANMQLGHIWKLIMSLYEMCRPRKLPILFTHFSTFFIEIEKLQLQTEIKRREMKKGSSRKHPGTANRVPKYFQVTAGKQNTTVIVNKISITPRKQYLSVGLVFQDDVYLFFKAFQ